MKIVSFYEMAPDALSKIMVHYPAHRARLDEFHARGVILAAGISIRTKSLWTKTNPFLQPKSCPGALKSFHARARA
jgi:hypothetical protein